MTFDIEIVLRDSDRAVTETVEHATDAAAWTEHDVAAVLRAMLRAIDRVKRPNEGEPAAIVFRGVSWIVEPVEGQVVIALEIPMGAVVAGPFDIAQERLDGMVARVMSAGDTGSARVH